MPSVALVHRRLFLGLAGGFLALAFYLLLGTESVSAHPGHDHARFADSGQCGPGMYAVGELGHCTHGPDPAPPGVDASEVDPPADFTAATSTICDGDGQSGARVQVVYARASDVPDRFAEYKNSFGAWAAQADQIYRQSAAVTGGERYVRFAHDSNCAISVIPVTLSPAGDDDIFTVTGELTSQGYSREDRKYMVFLDKVGLGMCGQGLVIDDDAYGQANLNNVFTGWGSSSMAAGRTRSPVPTN
jgi:hypothetical protein